jgi:hypothetical protein
VLVGVVARLEPELELRATTYQALFDVLRVTPGLDRDYIDYLGPRYFK